MNGTLVSIVSYGVSKQVEIKVLKKDEDNLRLLIRGVNVPHVNALRRIVTLRGAMYGDRRNRDG